MKKFSRIETEAEGVRLDKKDKKILDLLVRDARLSNTAIAKKVALSRDAVKYRIDRLINKGVIQGFAAVPDYDTLGFMKFRFFILVAEHDASQKKELLAYLEKHPNTVRVLEFSDRWDLEVAVIAKSINDYNVFLKDLHKLFSKIILQEESLLVVERFAAPYLPLAFYSGKETTDKHDLDESDKSILKELDKDARTPFYTIGERLKKDADTVNNRLKKMRETGVINRVSAIVNISKLDYHFYVFTAQMRHVTNDDAKRLKNLVATNKNVIETNRTFGPYDVLTYIAADKPKVLHSTVKEFKQQFAHSVLSYLTLVTYKEHFYEPLPEVLFKD